MRTHLVLVVAALVVASAGGACRSGGPAEAGGTAPAATGAVTGSITVAAAASLTEPFTAIGDAFTAEHPGAEVTFTFDSSGTLSKQIRDGAPVDVFASADEANLTELTADGLLAGRPQVFARNQLAIVVEAGNPANVRTLADLATVGTVSLCGTDVPCGSYAERVLGDAGVTIPEASITRGQNAKATLAAVAEGDADAGIVYVTDITGGRVEAVAIPQEQNAVATYPIGVLASSTDVATAEAFVAFVLGDEGQAILRDAGFLPRS